MSTGTNFTKFHIVPPNNNAGDENPKKSCMRIRNASNIQHCYLQNPTHFQFLYQRRGFTVMWEHSDMSTQPDVGLSPMETATRSKLAKELSCAVSGTCYL